MQRRRFLKALAGAPLVPFIVPDERIWFGEHLEPDDSFEQWCLDGAPDETTHECVSFITMRQPNEASYRFTDDDARLEVWIRHGDELHQCHCGHSWTVEPATRYSQQVVRTGTRIILDEGGSK